MSDKLAITSALSVLMMASYVLLGGQARQVDIAAIAQPLPQIAAPSLLPPAAALLPR